MATYKTLYLMRHAEAEPQDFGTDHARKLTKHGERQATSVGQQLLANAAKPSTIMVSNATRTTQTTQLILPQLWPDGNKLPHIAYHLALYNCNVSALMAAIDSIPDATAEAMIIGHNPAISDVIYQLLGTPTNLQVAEVVGLRWQTLDIEEPWVSAVSAKPTLLWHLRPVANSQLS